MIGTLHIAIEPQPELRGASGIQSDGAEVGFGWWDWNNRMWGEDVGEPELETACPFAQIGDRLKLRSGEVIVTDVHVDRVDDAWSWIIELG